MNDNKPAVMQAIRLYGNISHEHKLEIELPNTVQEGPAEVILFPQNQLQNDHHESLETFLLHLCHSPRNIKTKEELDHYIETQRNSWG